MLFFLIVQEVRHQVRGLRERHPSNRSSSPRPGTRVPPGLLLLPHVQQAAEHRGWVLPHGGQEARLQGRLRGRQGTRWVSERRAEREERERGRERECMSVCMCVTVCVCVCVRVWGRARACVFAFVSAFWAHTALTLASVRQLSTTHLLHIVGMQSSASEITMFWSCREPTSKHPQQTTKSGCLNSTKQQRYKPYRSDCMNIDTNRSNSPTNHTVATAWT